MVASRIFYISFINTDFKVYCATFIFFSVIYCCIIFESKIIIPVYFCRKLFTLFVAENLALLYLADYEIPDFVMMKSTTRKLGGNLVGATCVSTYHFSLKK